MVDPNLQLIITFFTAYPWIAFFVLFAMGSVIHASIKQIGETIRVFAKQPKTDKGE